MSHDAIVSIGDTVRQYRTARGLSYRTLSSAVGIDQAKLHRIEHGADARLSEAVALARFFQFSLDELLEIPSAPAPDMSIEDRLRVLSADLASIAREMTERGPQ